MTISSKAWFAAVLVSLQLVSKVSAHGLLTKPASRNAIDGNAGCAHCLNGGGPCGSSKFLNYYAGSQETWTGGSVVPITIRVTAHHMGHYEFRICDKKLDSSVSNPDTCLNRWVMERATPEEAGFTDCELGDQRPGCVPFDPKHPERWYLPPSTEGGSGTHTIYFKVPADMQCEECTLQWHWWSANSCEPAGDYGCFRDILQSKGYWVGSKRAWWTAFRGACSGPEGSNGHSGCGEQFWNCADITVQPGGGSPSPSPAPFPTPMPTPVPTPLPAPTPMPMPQPMPTQMPLPAPTPAASCETCARQFSRPCVSSDGLCNPVMKDACVALGGLWCGDMAPVTSTSPLTRSSTTTITTTTIMAGSFQAVDGGEGRACRGSSASDNLASYYSLESGVVSLEDCKGRCMASTACTGIEFNPTINRCEVWTRSIESSIAVSGFTCYTFHAVQGGCRVRFPESLAAVEDCSRVCEILSPGVWPCSSDGPCDCSPGPMLLTRSRKHQLRGRAQSLDVGLGLIQQNSSTVSVKLDDLDEEECRL